MSTSSSFRQLLSAPVLCSQRQELLSTGAAVTIRVLTTQSCFTGTRNFQTGVTTASSLSTPANWLKPVNSVATEVPLPPSAAGLLRRGVIPNRNVGTFISNRGSALVQQYGTFLPAVRPLLCLPGKTPLAAYSSSKHAQHAIRHYTTPGGFQFKLSVTNIILVINCVGFALQNLTNHKFTNQFMKSNPEIRRGEYWRLLTPAFLHADIMHLLVNSYSLYNLGNFMEPWSGDWRFLTIYLVSAVAGNIASFYYNRYPAVGASTSIFGLIGAELLFWYRHKDVFPNASGQVQQLLMITAFNLVYGFMNKGIDNSGHIGGFFGGLLAAWLLGPAFVRTYAGWEDKPPVGAMAWKDRRF